MRTHARGGRISNGINMKRGAPYELNDRGNALVIARVVDKGGVHISHTFNGIQDGRAGAGLFTQEFQRVSPEGIYTQRIV